MKRCVFGLLIVMVLCSCFPAAVVRADDGNLMEVEFNMDYELTHSDDTYNYYTITVSFNNPGGCDFGLEGLYYCKVPDCACYPDKLNFACMNKPESYKQSESNFVYPDSLLDGAEPLSGELTYYEKVPNTIPVYRFTIAFLSPAASQEGDAVSFRYINIDKVLTPTVTPEMTPEPTVEPEVSPEPTPPLPQVSVSIGAAYSGDEFTVSSTGTVKSSYTGTAVLEIWARGTEERCVSTTAFESGTASISFSADRYSPYKRFYGKITYTYTDAEGNTQAVVKYTSDDVEIKFQDYVPKDDKTIGSLGDLLYYTWNNLLELEIPFEGYSISFKAIILFIIVAMAVIVFIKRQFGY